MNIQNVLGKNIRFFREAKGWSQDVLSEKSNLHRTYISGVERGIRNPTVEIVQKIAVALEVAASDLFKPTPDED